MAMMATSVFDFGVFMKSRAGEPSGRNFSSEGEFMFLVNITDGEREPDTRLPDVNLITRMSIGGECNWLLSRGEVVLAMATTCYMLWGAKR